MWLGLGLGLGLWPVAVAPSRPLAREPPYAPGAALQSKTDKERMKESRKEKKKKKTSERNRKKVRSACGGSAEINPPGIHEAASC